MPIHRTALLSVVAMSLLLLVAVCTSDAAMERSQWRERGLKPPPLIGTDAVHPRKPFDQDQSPCAPGPEVEKCTSGSDAPDRSTPQPLQRDDRRQH